MTTETTATSSNLRQPPIGKLKSKALLYPLAAIVICLTFAATSLHAAQPRTTQPRPAGTPAGAPARSPARAPTTLPAALPADLARYEVTQFSFNYNTPAQGQVSLNELGLEPITLGRVRGGFVAPREGVPNVALTLAELSSDQPRGFYGSAIKHIGETVRDHLNRRNLIGVFVAPHPEDISETTGEDQRRDSKRLRMVIYTGRVKEVRTLASGERIALEERVNNPRHKGVAEKSPVKPGEVLNKEELDHYVFWLNRHPGRRVDVAIANTDTPEQVVLDYLIAETKPWQLYFQVSNTGTENTSEWRERFGFIQTQLTNNDDILNLDYTTAGFEDSHTFAASYEAPFFRSRLDRVRWRIYGTFNDFTASDIGLTGDVPGLDDFESQELMGGGELIANLWQNGQFFLDVFGGAAYRDIEVDGPAGPAEGSWVSPYGGVRIDRRTDRTITFGELRLTHAIGDVEDQTELDRLGRINAEEDFTVLTYDVSQSFFLEPLINKDSTTLAHELFFALRGQYAFDDRLIAQWQDTLGGFFTVRGYEESIIAADSSIIFTAEYRFHLPRSLSVQQEPGDFFGREFRWRPARQYARPDWDLIFRGFFDYGEAIFSDPQGAEEDTTLMGAGIGVELQIRQNINLRLDWGIVLEEVEVDNDTIDSGDSRLHFLATFVL